LANLSFELTMPNVGSWNGKWTGAEKKYYAIRSVHKKMAERLLSERQSHYYNFGDGWGAMVSMEVVDAKEARRRRNLSAGFCGYDRMIQDILTHGRILKEEEERKE
jgi:hypothetical protein